MENEGDVRKQRTRLWVPAQSQERIEWRQPSSHTVSIVIPSEAPEFEDKCQLCMTDTGQKEVEYHRQSYGQKKGKMKNDMQRPEIWTSNTSERSETREGAE